jgi:hypothetical protein
MPPAYVKPHVKRQKSDAAAAATCEGAPLVETKTLEQQACLMLIDPVRLLARLEKKAAG